MKRRRLLSMALAFLLVFIGLPISLGATTPNVVVTSTPPVIGEFHLTFGGTQPGIPTDRPLAPGYVERIFIDGVSVPVDRITWTVPPAYQDYIEVDGEGNVRILDTAVLTGTMTVSVQATIEYFDEEDVIFFDHFDDGETLFTHRTGSMVFREDNLLNSGGFLGYQASRTGRTGVTGGTVSGIPGVNMPTGTTGNVVFWYFDPLNDVEPPGSNGAQFFVNISQGAAQGAVGNGTGDNPTPTDWGRALMGVSHSVGWANTRRTHYTFRGGPTTQSSAQSGATPVERTFGWRKFEYRVTDSGTRAYIDGVFVRDLGSNFTSVESLTLAMNWFGGASTRSYISGRHFIDSVYVTREDAITSTVQREVSFEIAQSYTVTVNNGFAVRTPHTMASDEITLAGPGTVLTVTADTPRGQNFVGWTATGITLTPEQATQSRIVVEMPGNSITLAANFANRDTVRFGAISDMHVGRQRDGIGFDNNTITDRTYNIHSWFASQGLDAVVWGGDNTCDGGGTASVRINRLRSTADGLLDFPTNPQPNRPVLVPTTGNHDVWGTGGGNQANYFQQIFGLYTTAEYEIDGIRFISFTGGPIVSGDPANNQFNTRGSESTAYGDPVARAWLRSRVNAAAVETPGMPLFVIMHHPMANTHNIFNGYQGGRTGSQFGNGTAGNPFYFLNDPHVVVLNGHSHAPINDPRNVFQSQPGTGVHGFTTVNIPSTEYLAMERNSANRGQHFIGGSRALLEGSNSNNNPRHPAHLGIGSSAAGLIIEVDGPRVRIEAYCFGMEFGPNDTPMLLDLVWEFEIGDPDSFTYTNARFDNAVAPVWEAGSRNIEVRDITHNSFEVEFDRPIIPGANQSQDMVAAVNFRLYNVATGARVFDLWQWTDIMFPHYMADTITQCFGGRQVITQANNQHTLALGPLIRPEGQLQGTEFRLEVRAQGAFLGTSTDYLSVTFTTDCLVGCICEDCADDHIAVNPPLQTWTDNQGTLSVTVSHQVFASLQLNGTDVPATGFTTTVNADNTTTITINEAFLATLAVGTHSFVATFGTGEDTEFTVFQIIVPVAFVPVTGITGVPTTATAGTPLNLVGTVAPANATNSTIAWSVVNAGATGATIDGNVLTATAAGTVVVRATITNGLTETSPYTQDFTITVNATAPAFVPVTGITGVPTTATAGTPLNLVGTVAPANATNSTILWSVVNAGATGATIAGNVLTATAAGTVVVRATITNGTTATTDYTQEFTITVTATDTGTPHVPVTGITVANTTFTAGGNLTLAGVVAPANATNSTITWEIVTGAGTTAAGAALNGAVLTATGAGTIRVRAIVANGATATTAYTHEFTVTVNAATDTGTPHVPVTGITVANTTFTASGNLTLAGVVAPTNATNSTITWEIVTGAGTTAPGAALNGAVLTATGAGTIRIRAIVANGATATTAFTHEFTVTVNAATMTPTPPTGESFTLILGALTLVGVVAGYAVMMKKKEI